MGIGESVRRRRREGALGPLLHLAGLIGEPVTGFVHALPRAPITRLGRGAQLLASSLQIALALLRWDHVVILHGNCFKWGRGRLRISTGRRARTALRDLLCLEPFGLVLAPAGAKRPLSDLQARLNLDDADALEGKLVLADVVTLGAERDDEPVVVSLASDKRARSHLVREAAALRWLRDHPDETGFRSLSPKVRSVEQLGNCTVLTLSRLPGHECNLADLDERQFLEHLKKAAGPWLDQHRIGKRRPDGPAAVVSAFLAGRACQGHGDKHRSD